MALPNGYCGLPLTQNCETANQCLDCPMFLTTKDFLGQHQHQRNETARLIAVAENNGQFRMVQTNTVVLTKLDRIIGQLQQDSPLGNDEHESTTPEDTVSNVEALTRKVAASCVGARFARTGLRSSMAA